MVQENQLSFLPPCYINYSMTSVFFPSLLESLCNCQLELSSSQYLVKACRIVIAFRLCELNAFVRAPLCNKLDHVSRWQDARWLMVDITASKHWRKRRGYIPLSLMWIPQAHLKYDLHYGPRSAAWPLISFVVNSYGGIPCWAKGSS